MPNKLIINFSSGSISDTSLGIIGDPSTGALSQTGYRAMKDYFTAGITGSGGNVNTGSLATTASLNAFISSYNIDSSSFNSHINNGFLSQSNYELTGSFNVYTSSLNTQVLNVFASESNYLSTASYKIDSASFYTRLSTIVAGSSGSGVLNFIVGDGQSFTPSASSTVFSSSIIVNRTILQLQQEGQSIAPVSRSIAWFTVTSSIGQINLNNSNFTQDTFFQILYT